MESEYLAVVTGMAGSLWLTGTLLHMLKINDGMEYVYDGCINIHICVPFFMGWRCHHGWQVGMQNDMYCLHSKFPSPIVP